MIEHRSLVNYIWWAKDVYAGGEGLSWPLFSSLAFDLTVTSIFTPLITGGRIVVYHDETWTHGTALLKVIEDRVVNIIKLTPAHLAMAKELDLHGLDLKGLIVGGEDLKTDLARAITRQVGKPVAIYNEYGPTEATVGCMIHRFDPERDQTLSVPIGVPAANTGIFVLDDEYRAVGPLVVGQMFLAGDGLARGYLNRPDLTEQRFITIPDPRAEHSGASLRVYQTGDLARWTEDGRLIFLGRSDHQVKIGGARIELGEIEARLQEHPDVRECVVSVVAAPGELPGAEEAPAQRLAAYYVGTRPLTVPELRTFLGGALPEFMLPSYFIPMTALPLTTNGKVDRAALPQPASDRPDVSAAFVEQRSPTEEGIAEIWQEALKVSKVGVHDDFFELGGKSLPAMRILMQIKRTFGVEVPVLAFFANPTIGELASLIDRQRGGRA
jgi:acyl-coenzyme A synthetase/AMP-(fatty) acid ligase/acyl carrier protein